MRRLIPILALAAACSAAEVRRSAAGYTTYGEWSTEMRAAPDAWSPGDTVRVSATLFIANAHLSNLANDNIKVDGVTLLVTAERTFDAQGWIRLPSDERMSTLLTPTGLPIEGGLPIIHEGKIIGAIGVSGVKANEDGVVAQAGLEALKAKP